MAPTQFSAPLAPSAQRGSAPFDLLEPVTRATVEAIVTAAAARGIEPIVTETYRSRARQAELFAQHATQLHDDGKASWAGDRTFLAEPARANGLISGGDWVRRRNNTDFAIWIMCSASRCGISRGSSPATGIRRPTYNPYPAVVS